MEHSSEPTTTTLRPRRRWRWVLAALLVVIVFAISALQIARGIGARMLSTALGAPVHVGALWWLPWNGRFVAHGVAVGEGENRVGADRISALLNPLGLSRSEVVVDRLEIDAPTAPVEVTDQYGISIGALGGGGGGASATPPHIAVRELVVNGGTIAVRYPVAGATRSATIRVERFVARDVDVSPSPTGLRISASGDLEGAMDRAPVRGSVQMLLAGADTKITGVLSVSALPVNRDVVPLPPGLDTFTGSVDVQATLEIVAGTPGRQTVQAKVDVSEPRWGTPDGAEMAAKHAALDKVRLDLLAKAIDLGPISIDEPSAVITVTDAGVALPVPSSAPVQGPRPTWKMSSDAIQLRRGSIRLQRGESTLALKLESARWDGLQPDKPGKLAASLRTDGGTIDVTGTLGASPPTARLDAHIDNLALPPFSAFVPGLPVPLSRGTVAGDLRITARSQLEQLDGTLHFEDVHTAPPDPSFATEVMAVHTADVELTVALKPKLAVDIAAMKVAYPYVMVQRRRAGTFPYSLLVATEPAETTPVSERSGAGMPDVRVRHLQAEGGHVEFVDATLSSPYWTSLTDATAEAHDVRLPDATVGYFKLTGKQDELSPVVVSGSLGDDGLEARITVSDVLLESMNAYVAPILGYKMMSGRLSVTATAMPVPPLLQSQAEVVLEGVDVSQTGVDLVREQSGVPLPIALGLIANAAGEIRLGLPFTVDPAARSVSLGSVIWQALRSAIVGALSTPIRLLGSLFGTEGAPHAFAVDPIPFPTGSASLDVHGRARVDQIARILQAHRTLALVILPQLTAADLAAAGPNGAASLAAARTDAVRQALSGAAADPRIAAERLLPATWTPATGAEPTGKAGVYIELQEGGWTSAATE